MADSTVAYSSGNRLVDVLMANGLPDLKDDITIVRLKAHQSTNSIGKTMHHVDFPIDAVLSVVATLKNGDTVEVGTTGNERFVQSEAALESALSPRTSFCQVQGRVGRMDIKRFDEYMKTSDIFGRFMRKNLSAVLFSSQQFTVCNIKHSVIERCARWLAMTADRVGKPHFTLAHEFLAIMLGVRAVSVTEAADKLHEMGAITYCRGAVTIVDGDILKRSSCECYEASKAAFDVSLLC
jgi:CRP-like cAMP-binding protein